MNIADKTVLNILAKSSEAFLLLISSMVMVRYLSKSDYGTFLQVMLIANTTIMLTLIGLPHSIYYFFHHVQNRENFVIRNVIISLCIGAIAAILIYIIRGILADLMNNPLLSEYGWITALIVFFRSPPCLREPILISHGSLILDSFAALVCNLIIYIPIVIGTFFLQPLKVLLIIMAISAFGELSIFLALMLKVILSESKKSRSDDIEHDAKKMDKVSLKQQLRYALPIGISSYIGIIGRQIDQYIVSAFFTPKDFAVYSRGALRIPVLSTIQFTINNVMMPKYVSAYQAGDTKTFLRYFHTCTEKVAKINFPVFSFLFAVAPSIVTLLYTKEYVDASYILRAYLFLLITSISVYSIIPRASGETSFIMYATSISVAANIILSLCLVLIFGPVGAAIATVISMVIGIFYYLFHDCKMLGVSFDKILPWSCLIRLMIVSLIASVPVYCLEYFYADTINLFFLLLIEALIYFYCCIFLMIRQGLILQEDMDLLKKWLKFDVERFLYRLAFFKVQK